MAGWVGGWVGWWERVWFAFQGSGSTGVGFADWGLAYMEKPFRRGSGCRVLGQRKRNQNTWQPCWLVA